MPVDWYYLTVMDTAKTVKVFNRIIVGIALFALAFLLNALGPIFWSIAVFAICILGYLEFKNLCNNMGVFLVDKLIYFFITLFVLGPNLIPELAKPLFIFVFNFALIILFYVIVFPRILLKSNFTKFEDLTMSLWAMIHLGVFGGFFTWLRILDNGFFYILIIVFTVAANDTGSLLFGKLFGKKQLAPRISPYKTFAGSIGGMLSAAACFWFFFNSFEFKFISYFEHVNFLAYKDWIVVAIGLMIALISQIGDLLVSALKRAAGVKDSGKILLSHGGVLDRVDGIIFASWFAFLLFAFVMN